MDFYGFYTGKEFEAYRYLGAQYSERETVFHVFAPSAKKVSLLLEDGEYPMKPVYNGQFYEAVISNIKDGTLYEYRIYRSDMEYTDHADPYGFGMELRPAHKSVVRDMNSYVFEDEKWRKKKKDILQGPVNIYELHLGSFKKPGSLQEDWYTYEELISVLIPYLKENGYNFVEFMPLSEHPCDESWGYQNTGFFAPTSRYGTAAQLKMLVDALHQAEIGVILDFVPVHFAVDSYGLSNFDGTSLYEYPHQDVGVSEWGSCNFMHSRGEVRSFLQSAAQYWLNEYHFDGLRMDAISRIIYWQGDEKRGVNGMAVDFIRNMNLELKKRHPDCILAAEDSTNFSGVTKPAEEGGLGFDLKWNMGWMNDTLAYFKLPSSERKQQYHKLTFSMMYAYNEQYLLPLSHDEVVHGKGTILQKMNGTYEEKFAQAKVLYLYMMMHPGKKLNFMGNEIGQFREWDEKREQDWELLKYPMHDAFHQYMKKLNHLYLESPSLSEKDYLPEGFQWLDCHQEERCIYAMMRRSGTEKIAAVFNLSGEVQQLYEIPLPEGESYEEILNTDWQCFGGKLPYDKYNKKIWELGDRISLAPYSGVLLR